MKLEFHDLHPTAVDLRREVLAGLGQRPRSIPPKFFYDARGSELFDAITRTEEYYPTRTEMAILERNAEAIAARIGTGTLLVEPGGGSCAKVRILLDGLRPCAYVPMDISRTHLQAAAEQVAAEFPWLEVHAACADFTNEVDLPIGSFSGPRLAFFPGSSIGNFAPAQAVAFLETIRLLVGDGGLLLIGVDLQKDPVVLERAYNDAAGVTAAFNRNLLARINLELGADFVLDAWAHHAFYDAVIGRIEMHLLSQCRQRVTIGDAVFDFAQGETIHTENSYKYTIPGFQRLAQAAGFVPDVCWTDDQQWFSVQLFRAGGATK
jgi:dimethylhistidine N-methyltransferase